MSYKGNYQGATWYSNNYRPRPYNNNQNGYNYQPANYPQMYGPPVAPGPPPPANRTGNKNKGKNNKGKQNKGNKGKKNDKKQNMSVEKRVSKQVDAILGSRRDYVYNIEMMRNVGDQKGWPTHAFLPPPVPYSGEGHMRISKEVFDGLTPEQCESWLIYRILESVNRSRTIKGEATRSPRLTQLPHYDPMYVADADTMNRVVNTAIQLIFCRLFIPAITDNSNANVRTRMNDDLQPRRVISSVPMRPPPVANSSKSYNTANMLDFQCNGTNFPIFSSNEIVEGSTIVSADGLHLGNGAICWYTKQDNEQSVGLMLLSHVTHGKKDIDVVFRPQLGSDVTIPITKSELVMPLNTTDDKLMFMPFKPAHAAQFFNAPRYSTYKHNEGIDAKLSVLKDGTIYPLRHDSKSGYSIADNGVLRKGDSGLPIYSGASLDTLVGVIVGGSDPFVAVAISGEGFVWRRSERFDYYSSSTVNTICDNVENILSEIYDPRDIKQNCASILVPPPGFQQQVPPPAINDLSRPSQITTSPIQDPNYNIGRNPMVSLWDDFNKVNRNKIRRANGTSFTRDVIHCVHRPDTYNFAPKLGDVMAVIPKNNDKICKVNLAHITDAVEAATSLLSRRPVGNEEPPLSTAEVVATVVNFYDNNNCATGHGFIAVNTVLGRPEVLLCAPYHVVSSSRYVVISNSNLIDRFTFGTNDLRYWHVFGAGANKGIFEGLMVRKLEFDSDWLFANAPPLRTLNFHDIYSSKLELSICPSGAQQPICLDHDNTTGRISAPAVPDVGPGDSGAPILVRASVNAEEVVMGQGRPVVGYAYIGALSGGDGTDIAIVTHRGLLWHETKDFEFWSPRRTMSVPWLKLATFLLLLGVVLGQQFDAPAFAASNPAIAPIRMACIDCGDGVPCQSPVGFRNPNSSVEYGDHVFYELETAFVQGGHYLDDYLRIIKADSKPDVGILIDNELVEIDLTRVSYTTTGVCTVLNRGGYKVLLQCPGANGYLKIAYGDYECSGTVGLATNWVGYEKIHQQVLVSSNTSNTSAVHLMSYDSSIYYEQQAWLVTYPHILLPIEDLGVGDNTYAEGCALTHKLVTVKGLVIYYVRMAPAPTFTCDAVNTPNGPLNGAAGRIIETPLVDHNAFGSHYTNFYQGDCDPPATMASAVCQMLFVTNTNGTIDFENSQYNYLLGGYRASNGYRPHTNDSHFPIVWDPFDNGISSTQVHENLRIGWILTPYVMYQPFVEYDFSLSIAGNTSKRVLSAVVSVDRPARVRVDDTSVICVSECQVDITVTCHNAHILQVGNNAAIHFSTVCPDDCVSLIDGKYPHDWVMYKACVLWYEHAAPASWLFHFMHEIAIVLAVLGCIAAIVGVVVLSVRKKKMVKSGRDSAQRNITNGMDTRPSSEVISNNDKRGLPQQTYVNIGRGGKMPLSTYSIAVIAIVVWQRDDAEASDFNDTYALQYQQVSTYTKTDCPQIPLLYSMGFSIAIYSLCFVTVLYTITLIYIKLHKYYTRSTKCSGCCHHLTELSVDEQEEPIRVVAAATKEERVAKPEHVLSPRPKRSSSLDSGAFEEIIGDEYRDHNSVNGYAGLAKTAFRAGVINELVTNVKSATIHDFFANDFANNFKDNTGTYAVVLFVIAAVAIFCCCCYSRMCFKVANRSTSGSNSRTDLNLFSVMVPERDALPLRPRAGSWGPAGPKSVRLPECITTCIFACCIMFTIIDVADTSTNIICGDESWTPIDATGVAEITLPLERCSISLLGRDKWTDYNVSIDGYRDIHDVLTERAVSGCAAYKLRTYDLDVVKLNKSSIMMRFQRVTTGRKKSFEFTSNSQCNKLLSFGGSDKFSLQARLLHQPLRNKCKFAIASKNPTRFKTLVNITMRALTSGMTLRVYDGVTLGASSAKLLTKYPSTKWRSSFNTTNGQVTFMLTKPPAVTDVNVDFDVTIARDRKRRYVRAAYSDETDLVVSSSFESEVASAVIENSVRSILSSDTAVISDAVATSAVVRLTYSYPMLSALFALSYFWSRASAELATINTATNSSAVAGTIADTIISNTPSPHIPAATTSMAVAGIATGSRALLIVALLTSVVYKCDAAVSTESLNSTHTLVSGVSTSSNLHIDVNTGVLTAALVVPGHEPQELKVEVLDTITEYAFTMKYWTGKTRILSERKFACCDHDCSGDKPSIFSAYSPSDYKCHEQQFFGCGSQYFPACRCCVGENAFVYWVGTVPDKSVTQHRAYAFLASISDTIVKMRVSIGTFERNFDINMANNKVLTVDEEGLSFRLSVGQPSDLFDPLPHKVVTYKRFLYDVDFPGYGEGKPGRFGDLASSASSDFEHPNDLYADGGITISSSHTEPGVSHSRSGFETWLAESPMPYIPAQNCRINVDDSPVIPIISVTGCSSGNSLVEFESQDMVFKKIIQAVTITEMVCETTSGSFGVAYNASLKLTFKSDVVGACGVEANVPIHPSSVATTGMLQSVTFDLSADRASIDLELSVCGSKVQCSLHSSAPPTHIAYDGAIGSTAHVQADHTFHDALHSVKGYSSFGVVAGLVVAGAVGSALLLSKRAKLVPGLFGK